MSRPETLAAQTLPREASSAHIHPMRVTVVGGPDAGKVVVATGDRLIIGTHPDADLVLRDVEISPFHCEISLSDGRPELHDLESKHGTTVNGVEVMAARLESGATITLGGTQLSFEL